MMLFYIICAFITGCYFLLILAFIIGFNRLKTDVSKQVPEIAFSIIIPFRNEARRLPELLASISAMNYDTSLFEVILVDDESTDSSVQIISDFQVENPQCNIRIIENVRSSNSPKKDAISTAIHKTNFNWIISTDADCVLPKEWLNCFNSFILKNNPNMVVSPVSFNSDTSFLAQFQLIDFLSMQGATIGGFGIEQPFMANGANLAYKKELFIELNGFNDNNFIASGDDVFLLENFIKHDKTKVLFLKDNRALVNTFPVSSWSSLINQRKRWAAKATHFKNSFTKIVGVLVFFANCISAIAIPLSFFNLNFLWLVLLKFFIDTILIYKTAHLYQQKAPVSSYLKTVVFYPYFTVFIAITSMLSPFEWKDRAFRK